MNAKALKAASIGIILSVSSIANAGLINLNNWTGTSGGSWNVDASGTSVLQGSNTPTPTYFLSDTNYINSEFNGTFGVETSSDDDFIGFVFGYNNSTDFLIFDWKQNDQTYNPYGGFSPAGYTLSQISGSDHNLWTHSGNDITVLASDYLGNPGWSDNTTYSFTLDFTTSGISIDIDGTNIFQVNGSFNTGKFGFYNYSQSNVRYTGFEESASLPVPEPSTLAIFALGIMGLASRRFAKK